MEQINLKPLKAFAKKELKNYQLTRELIIEEPDYIPVEEFIFKFKVWLQLLEKDIERSRA